MKSSAAKVFVVVAGASFGLLIATLALWAAICAMFGSPVEQEPQPETVVADQKATTAEPTSLKLSNTLTLDYLTVKYGSDWQIKSQKDMETVIDGPGSIRLTVTLDYIGSHYVTSAADASSVSKELSRYFTNHLTSLTSKSEVSVGTNGTSATVVEVADFSKSNPARKSLMLIAFNGNEAYRVNAEVQADQYQSTEALFQEIISSVNITRVADTGKATVVEDPSTSQSSSSASGTSNSTSSKYGSSSSSGSKSSSSSSSSGSNSSSSSSSSGSTSSSSKQDTGVKLPSEATDSRVKGTTSKVESYCKKTYKACKSASVSVQSWEVKNGTLYVHGDVEMRTSDGTGRYYGNFDAVYSGSSSTPDVKLSMQGK